MNSWYWRAGSRLCGPLTLEELVVLREQGKVLPEHEVRRGDRGAWIAAGRVRELFDENDAVRSPIGQQAANVAAAAAGGERVLSPETRSAVPTPQFAAESNSSASSVAPNRPKTAPRIPPIPNVATAMTGRPVAGLPPAAARRIAQTEVADDAGARRVTIGAAAFGILLIMLCVCLALLLGRRGPANGGGGAAIAGRGSGESNDGTSASGVSANGNGADAGGGESRAGNSSGGESSENRREVTPSPASPPEESRPPRPDNSPAKNARGPSPPKPTFGIRGLPAASVDTTAAESTSAGALGDFQGRLAREGAGAGDIQVSLLWNDFNDVDLHVRCPSGEVIKFDHSRSRCGGNLDVDMNAGGADSDQPVENIFWPEGRAPRGEYRVYVHFFAPRVSNRSEFEVAVKVNGATRRFRGTAVLGAPAALVHTFHR